MSASSSPLHDLRAAVGADVTGPDDPGAAAWNPLRSGRPMAIVHVTDPRQIAATVRWAADHDRRVAVRATGHGIVAPDQSTVLVDTGRLDAVSVDAGAGTATIGAGVTAGAVIGAAAEHGLAPVLGSAATVGVAGLITGGGIGPMAHTLGLASDHVRALTVVTGDGEIRHVDADREPDLFWGLRGGKATLGIVSELELELPGPARFYGGNAFVGTDDIAATLRAWADWAPRLPREGTTSACIAQLPDMPAIPPPLAGRMTASVRFAWLGDPADGERLTAELLDGVTPVLGGYGPMEAADIAQIHQDPPNPTPAIENGYLLSSFDAGAADALVAAAGPGSGSSLVMAEVRRLDLPRFDATAPDAFDGRGAAANLMTGAVRTGDGDRERAQAAATPVLEALRPWSAGQALANYVVGDDADRIELVWAQDTRRRLATLADRYDPAGVLRVGQVARRE